MRSETMDMHEFKFHCSICDQPLKCEAQLAGRQIQCPACKHLIEAMKPEPSPHAFGFSIRRWSFDVIFPQLLFLATLDASFGQAPTLQFATTAQTVAEDAGAALITVQRLNDRSLAVTVDYATGDGTATNGLKYTAVSGTLAFGPGETNKSITVPILNDGFVEGAKNFRVLLSNPTGGAVLGTRTAAIVSITDDDVGLQFESGSATLGSYEVSEGDGFILIGVVRGDDGNFPVSVNYFTTDGTATNGVDYIGATNTLIFAAGEKARTFTIPILNDGIKESLKMFRVTLTNPTNQVLGVQKSATVRILDNDPGVQFQPTNQYWIAGNEGALTLTVARGNDSDLAPFTVDFATSDQGATSGSDYVGTNGTLTFGQGEMAKALSVPILYDDVAEADERFKVTLSNPTGGAVLGLYATATITMLDISGMKPHRFDGISALPDRSVQLTLSGGVHPRFRPFFDLYPIEVSTTLTDWTPLTTLVRSNASTNAVFYMDTGAATLETRFYRTAATNLPALFSSPTGPYAVGTFDRVLTDPSRHNRYGISTNSLFMATFWYPAQRKTGVLPEPMLDPGVAPYWYLNLVSGASVPLASRFYLQAYRDCPLATNRATYPVLIHSSGGLSMRKDNSLLAIELASHGYIVVSAEHADNCAMRMPDGRIVLGNGVNFGDSVFAYESRKQDLSVVLAELETMNRSDPMFAHHLALEKLGAFGWSSGGVASAQLCLEDDRVKAAVLLDPGLISFVPNLVNLGIRRPFIVITGSLADGRDLFNRATGTAYSLNITGSSHLNLSDLPLYSGSTSARRAAQIIQAYSLSFFNKHLLDNDDHLLDGPSPLYPEVPTLLKK